MQHGEVNVETRPIGDRPAEHGREDDRSVPEDHRRACGTTASSIRATPAAC